MKQVVETEAILAEVKEKMDRQPWRFFRIGTWSLGDSLAVDPVTGNGAQLVTAFASIPNGLLELKTKSANVDHLIGLPHNGRTVISWTLSPQRIVASDELKTASLDERLTAMSKVAADGYRVAAHFDPMFYYPGWEAEYDDLARRLFEAVDADAVAWISIGSLRFNPEMKKSMEKNFPKSLLTAAEMVTGPDGKMRYPKPIRVQMYKQLYAALRRHGGTGPFCYLCMEQEDVYRKVFNGDLTAGSTAALDYEITRSLHQRYPGLVQGAPDRQQYEHASSIDEFDAD
jgi:spore photoproduct lyase